MADWLEHATWFFDSAWGDVIVGIGVPIASAAVAAFLVIRQIRTAGVAREEDLRIAQQTRREDRRAEAVAVLSEYIADAATMAVDRNRLPDMALHTFRANAQLARAYGLLGRQDHAVGDWAGLEVVHMTNLTHQWGEKAAPRNEITFDGRIGADRTEIQKVGAEAIQTLLAWQGGDITLDWFQEHARATGEGPVRQSDLIFQESDAAPLQE